MILIKNVYIYLLGSWYNLSNKKLNSMIAKCSLNIITSFYAIQYYKTFNKL